MNLLVIYMDSQGNITDLNMSCPLTYMFLGLFCYAIAMGSTLVPEGRLPCFISFISGSILLISSYLIYLFQSNQLFQFLVIIGILSIILVFVIYKKLRSYFL